MATSDPIRFPRPYAEVFRSLVSVLPQHKIEVVSADEPSGTIHAKTGVTMRTWGETLTIRLGSPDGGATTEMVVESNLKFGLAAWGKHDKNFATITNAVNTALAGPTPPPTGQAGQPPPPQPQPTQTPPPQPQAAQPPPPPRQPPPPQA